MSRRRPKKRKTFLWVLGWVFIFPVPLTILMLRNNRMRPLFKYGIIGLAWAFYLFLVIGSIAAGGQPAEVSSPQMVSDVASAAAVSAEPTHPDLEVYIKPSAQKRDGALFFDIETNLPDGTQIMISLSRGANETFYMAQSKVDVSDGQAVSDGFSNNGEELKGLLDLCISMGGAQTESVDSVIGKNGENLTGPLVQKSDTGDSKTINALFLVSLAEEAKVYPSDDYKMTTWSSEGPDESVAEIDGQERAEEIAPTPEPIEETEPTPEPTPEITYIVNTSTKKFHFPNCNSVDEIKSRNKKETTKSRDELIKSGYDPCGKCKP